MQIPEGHGCALCGRSALMTKMAASIRKKVLVDKSKVMGFIWLVAYMSLNAYSNATQLLFVKFYVCPSQKISTPSFR
jgi:hypothetical protein